MDPSFNTVVTITQSTGESRRGNSYNRYFILWMNRHTSCEQSACSQEDWCGCFLVLQWLPGYKKNIYPFNKLKKKLNKIKYMLKAKKVCKLQTETNYK